MNPSSLCPKFEKAMNLISKRWVGLIVHQLLSGPLRFCNIESAIPISGRLLSERLKDLEYERIVVREVYPETPVRIVYSLTEKGLALGQVLRGMEQWAEDWVQVEDATHP